MLLFSSFPFFCLSISFTSLRFSYPFPTHRTCAGSHSHVRGLGLREDLTPNPTAGGLVGQTKARKGAGIIVKLVQSGGKGAVLLSGEPGTGKTAIATAIAQELGKDVPFTNLNASEIYSLEMSKTEALYQVFSFLSIFPFFHFSIFFILFHSFPILSLSIHCSFIHCFSFLLTALLLFFFTFLFHSLLVIGFL